MTRTGSVLAALGAGLGALTLVAYAALILSEGNDSLAEVAPWALAMAAATGTAAWGSVTARRTLVRVGGVIFLVIGVPAIFSVGLPLLVAGVLCLLADRLPARGRAAG